MHSWVEHEKSFITSGPEKKTNTVEQRWLDHIQRKSDANLQKQVEEDAIIQSITKTYLYNFDPLKPHFYIVKLGFTGVYIIFLISANNIDCGYSLEPPRRGGSNEYPQSMFWAEI